MKALKVTSLLLLTCAGIAILFAGGLLVLAPTDSFDTQGPGLAGAIAAFFGMMMGGVGVLLLIIWEAVTWNRRMREAKGLPSERTQAEQQKHPA